MRLRLAAVVGTLATLAATISWLATEVVMTPTSPERIRLIAMFVAFAAATVVVALAVHELTRRSISRRILGVTLIGPVIVGVATIVGARSMFISPHDTQFVLILTALATTLAVGVVAVFSRPLARDFELLRDAASRLGAGELSTRTGLDRTDELGSLGSAFDAMAQQLEDSRSARDRITGERRMLLTSLSHDARTPLTSMRAAVEALQDGMAPDPERYLNAIELDLSAVESIVENLFVLGRLDADQVDLHLEPLDLAALASKACHGLEPVGQAAGVALELVGVESVRVLASRTELLRVMTNLLSNAVRHSPIDTTVTIWIAANGDGQPTMTVTDHGPGFDPEFVSIAFDQFTRAEPARQRSHGGAGLGLAVSRGLIEQMGGSIWARPGPGGHVGFSLPIAPDR